MNPLTRIDLCDVLPDELMPYLPHVTYLRSDGPSEAEERDKAVSMATRKGLIETAGARWRAGTVAERSAILDEFVAITGYHRKHAVRLLSRPVPEPQKLRPSVRYGPAAREALGMLWEISERICSKRLKAMIPVLLPALVLLGKLEGDAALDAQLAEVNPATIDRLLAHIRLAATKGRRRAPGTSSAICRTVPIRTFWRLERS